MNVRFFIYAVVVGFVVVLLPERLVVVAVVGVTVVKVDR
jgi:hypothetical protein